MEVGPAEKGGVSAAPRALVVRFSAIGDCVMAAWAATAIREKHPDAFLCWGVESRCAPVIDRTSLASRVEEFPRDRWKRQRWSPKMWQEQVVKYGRLRHLRFDFGIDLQGHTKTALCLRLARPRHRIAVNATDAFAARLNPLPGPRPSGLHTVEWHMRVLETLGDFTLPTRPIMPRDPDAAAGLIERLGGERPLATIAVSAGQARKIYPAAQWDLVARELTQRGYQVAYVGGPGDPAIQTPNTLDWVGKLSLSTTIEAIRLSAVHVAADTGSGHIAAALGVPVVSLFGPTAPDAYRPFTDQGVVLREPEVKNIAPDVVLAAIKQLVGR